MRGNPACSHCKGLDAEIRSIQRMIAREESKDTPSEYWLKIYCGNLTAAQQRRAQIDARQAARQEAGE